MLVRYLGPGLQSLVVVGRVVAALGIRGEVKILPYSGRPDDLRAYAALVLAEVDLDAGTVGGAAEFTVTRSRGQGSFAVVHLEGVVDRNRAETLRDRAVLVYRHSLPALPPGQYYWHEIAGIEVFDRAGVRIGRLEDLFVTKAHPVLVVRGEQGECLLPAKDEFVSDVDLERRIMRIFPPEGLLEMNR